MTDNNNGKRFRIILRSHSTTNQNYNHDVVFVPLTWNEICNSEVICP